MYELINIRDDSVIASLTEYDDVLPALRAEHLRIRSTVGKTETTAHENVDLVIDGVRALSYRITPRSIERL